MESLFCYNSNEAVTCLWVNLSLVEISVNLNNEDILMFLNRKTKYLKIVLSNHCIGLIWFQWYCQWDCESWKHKSTIAPKATGGDDGQFLYYRHSWDNAGSGQATTVRPVKRILSFPSAYKSYVYTILLSVKCELYLKKVFIP